jgi:hypothetical protein
MVGLRQLRTICCHLHPHLARAGHEAPAVQVDPQVPRPADMGSDKDLK